MENRAKEIQRCGKIYFYPEIYCHAHMEVQMMIARHRKNRNMKKRGPEGVDKPCFIDAVHIVFSPTYILPEGMARAFC